MTVNLNKLNLAGTETLMKVTYMFGHLEGAGLIETNQDLDDIFAVITKVANDWSNFVDIQNFEEEGYPTAYAKRVLLETYNNKEGDVK